MVKRLGPPYGECRDGHKADNYLYPGDYTTEV